MRTIFTRRAALALLAGSAGTAALAEAPLTSLRPRPRPGPASAEEIARLAPRARPSLADIISSANLGGSVSVAVADVETGEIIEEQDAATALPPASVTKALTALYALETVGPRHRFATRLLATGPVADGRLDGDLILAGGGDPLLQTDELAALAVDLRAAGVTEITGRFLVWGGALPYEDEIDDSQLDHLGYNPAVSGLNLNFNRVHFEWARTGSDYRVTLDARSAAHSPVVSVARMRVENRSVPIYTYAADGEIDDWTVARAALGDGGARWLPVRRPALYAGDVFRTLAQAQGVTLPAAGRLEETPGGIELARHDSPEMEPIIRDMLRYSTNLTAEVVGLTATGALSGRPDDIPSSARAMNDWLARTHGVSTAVVDHSGLGDASRVAARDMVALLSAPGVMGRLSPVLKEHDLRDAEGAPMTTYPASVRAKTGTLNFVSALAGYIRTAQDRDVAFAIFCGNLERREVAKATGEEIPDGARPYAARARNLQQVLLRRWGLVHTG
ncbi:D-alanyl-D-alanine carboxypeptidase/D-alanyl-D-alanine endopeptidase [Histidinibacterium lentulum]|uniref:D-alanyl-D-alanine carboxypeptidase/D-alanyl-D-alanine-endopeptidase n=1 Tax=Histidinibacterium lentulum TaxID=2480588 RepID=A0A3N2R7J8_9RHOB|nr:D-alanyl-D-alanine carboxypeptidase/D-alanyl-D-alanine-endopeptidase [Histidinibacterium lentulum]ROU03434.1 D-alanyl-D-alanine carboxypeptidase/D-alanyl-D-alanine-endopeptidase [Histidinibacterium lentulum]